MKYACYFYSATGNTGRAIELIRQGLEAAGSTMDMFKIRKDMTAPGLDGYDGIILAFPVLAFTPPAFVMRFLRSLPGNRMPAAVLAVDGGGGGSAAAAAVRMLERRGYQVVLSAGASYADNWTQMCQPPDAMRAGEMTKTGDAMVARFIDALVAGATHPGGVGRKRSAIDAVKGFFFALIGRRFLGKAFYADEDCNACSLCARQCPVGAILLGEGKRARPFWKLDCEDCNACINLCPRKAINTSIGRLIMLIALVVAAAWAGIWAYFAYARPAFTGLLPPALGAAVDVLSVLIIALLAHVLPAGPFDRYVLRYVQRVPGVRRLFSWTFTKTWRRYRAIPPAAGGVK